MIEITRRIDGPDYVVQHPTIQALRDIANDLVGFANVRMFPQAEKLASRTLS